MKKRILTTLIIGISLMSCEPDQEPIGDRQTDTIKESLRYVRDKNYPNVCYVMLNNRSSNNYDVVTFTYVPCQLIGK